MRFSGGQGKGLQNSTRILEYKYEGYKSWYASLYTKVVIDSRYILEKDNENNTFKTEIVVKKR